MTEDTAPKLWAIRAPGASRAVLVGVAFLGMALLASLIYPLSSALLFAAVLAGALHPQYERLTRRLGGRPRLASAVVTFAVGALLGVPTISLVITAGREAVTGATLVERTLRDGGGLPALIDRLPPAIRGQARRAVEHLPGGSDQLQGLLERQAGNAAAAVTAAIAVAASVVVKVALMLVAIYFFLVDGKGLVQWFAAVAPLPGSQILAILSDFRTVSVAVLLSSLGTAGVQALAALAGYLAAGVPQPVFFAVVTFMLAFIPAVGAASVVLALAGLLYVTGHPQAAAGLALWGLLVVSTVDNLVKPWLLKDRMEIHGGLIFFALIGGLATFGPVGLVAGPLILSFFLAAVRLCGREPRPPAA